MTEIKTMEFKDDFLYLIDQRKLPVSYEIFQCKTYRDVDFAIKDMVVRGAPAIGAAAAYGVVLAAKEFLHEDRDVFFSELDKAMNILNRARPTAVNLMWAIRRMRNAVEKHKDLPLDKLYQRIKEEADRIYEEDINTNKSIGKHGNAIIPQKATILTHCNAGALATAGYGTALGVIREAFYSGKDIMVYADETRPRCQGGRLTAWELKMEGIPVRLIADSVAATLIRDGKIDVILVGADRIALNGDTANKIGTFMLSVVAKAYNVPFYVVAPVSTIDFDIKSGEEIVIEERDSMELTHIENIRIAPEGIEVYNPAFDVTPNENITGIITEKGIIKPPYIENIPKLKEA
ncbi:MAG TPA: S-methyl-5-thioribose-1-phosphate isomerase [Tissierellia bacterium]|nr:S-methyl-5-thioribose-1-phosphate isomerase [Tissierellia bacterium]